MRRLVALLLVLTACSGAGPEPLTGVFLRGTFDVEEFASRQVPVDEMRYLLWFPPSYASQPERDFPLIVFLHGSGDDDYDEQWVQSYGLPEVLVFDGPPDGFEFVVLAPQATPGTAWWSGRQMESVAALVESVTEDYRIDRASVAVTGLSMGGYGTWHLATERPDLFVSAVSISGSGYGFATLPDDVDVCRLAQVPVRVIHGERDVISLPEANLEVVEAFDSQCDPQVSIDLYPDQGHFETFANAYRDPALYEWMLSPFTG